MKKLFKNKQLVMGTFIVISIIIIAIFAPFIAPSDPVKNNLLNSLEAPGKKHLLGTDSLGRDQLSRIIYGSRISLMLGFTTQLINTIIGVILGVTAGYFGGRLDNFIMSLTNIMLSIPALILGLTIMAVLGPGMINIFIALGFTLWTYTCRLARAQTMVIKEKEFVKAAKAMGASDFSITVRHVIPHIIGPILVIATFGAASAILLEASLSFLGIGVQPPNPSWGAMLSRGREYIWTAPWLMIYPGLFLMITILGLNLMGDGLRDYWDPKM